jgi:hypothetical protein
MKTTSFYSLSTSRISVREDQERSDLCRASMHCFLFFSFLLQGHTSRLFSLLFLSAAAHGHVSFGGGETMEFQCLMVKS